MISGPSLPDEALIAKDKPRSHARRIRRPDPRRFYGEALSKAERLDLPAALKIEGMDEEIAVLRLRLRTAIEERPDDIELMFRGIGLIVRTVAARYRLSKQAERDLDSSLAGVVRTLGDLLPGGLIDE
ncbi:MAG: hypothetical protein GEU75_03360 [Dehalococcoidia bacterium]|nr:hypothetical protein [Dehalococcoidia bacterium]